MRELIIPPSIGERLDGDQAPAYDEDSRTFAAEPETDPEGGVAVFEDGGGGESMRLIEEATSMNEGSGVSMDGGMPKPEDSSRTGSDRVATDPSHDHRSASETQADSLGSMAQRDARTVDVSDSGLPGPSDSGDLDGAATGSIDVVGAAVDGTVRHSAAFTIQVLTACILRTW